MTADAGPADGPGPGPTDEEVADRARQGLLALTRTLGEPARELVILAEGNTSRRLTGGRMLVKASGSRMATAGPADFVEVDTERMLSVLELADPGDAGVTDALLASRTAGGPRPSIEALVHALCVTLGGAAVVGHTHPIALNRLLCSDRAGLLVAGSLFPDQVVVLGRHALLVPYAGPGLPVARLVAEGLRTHIAAHGRAPKVVYLANHGVFVLGGSEAEVLASTEMTVKVGRVLHGVLAVGRPRWLDPAEVDRLDTRDDERLRRERLFGTSPQ